MTTMPMRPPPTGSAVRAPGRPRRSSTLPACSAAPAHGATLPRFGHVTVGPRRSREGRRERRGGREEEEGEAVSATADAALALDAADEGDLKQAHGRDSGIQRNPRYGGLQAYAGTGNRTRRPRITKRSRRPRRGAGSRGRRARRMRAGSGCAGGRAREAPRRSGGACARRERGRCRWCGRSRAAGWKRSCCAASSIRGITSHRGGRRPQVRVAPLEGADVPHQQRGDRQRATTAVAANIVTSIPTASATGPTSA